MNVLAKQAHRHYQKTQVESANPAKLILMLYDGAIRFLIRATGSLSAGDKEAFMTDVVRAQRIITELMSVLDSSKNPEVALNLARIYEYMIRQLGLAMIRTDAAPATEVKDLLEDLREGWQGAISQMAQEAAVNSEVGSQGLSTSRTNFPPTVQPGLIPTLNIAG